MKPTSAITVPAEPSGWLRRILAVSSLWRRDRVDWRYGVDTSGEIPASELNVDSPNKAHSACYRAALGWIIRLFIQQLPVDPSRYEFIDFGSGKGRALLVASEFAFPRITGIEFVRDLHEAAVRNIALLPPARCASHRVISVLGDATAFALPTSDLVCYLYNPFGPPVLDAVLKNLIAHRRAGFNVYLIYINPKHLDAVQGTGAFEQIFAHRKGVILKAV